jgi:hypothetical protein
MVICRPQKSIWECASYRAEEELLAPPGPYLPKRRPSVCHFPYRNLPHKYLEHRVNSAPTHTCHIVTGMWYGMSSGPRLDITSGEKTGLPKSRHKFISAFQHADIFSTWDRRKYLHNSSELLFAAYTCNQYKVLPTPLVCLPRSPKLNVTT